MIANRHVRYWHKADMPSCTAHVRFRSKSEHAILRCTCSLLTQSRHQLVPSTTCSTSFGKNFVSRVLRILTQSRRWMFGRVLGLDGCESHRELRLERL